MENFDDVYKEASDGKLPCRLLEKIYPSEMWSKVLATLNLKIHHTQAKLWRVRMKISTLIAVVNCLRYQRSRKRNPMFGLMHSTHGLNGIRMSDPYRDGLDMNLVLGKNRSTASKISLEQKVLNRHVSLVGQTGSGKTVGLKVLIEEAAFAGIPSVVMDVQGDLSQFIIGVNPEEVAANGGDAERAQRFAESVEIRVWTPVRSKGLPICLNPFVAPSDDLDEEQKISSWDMMAAGFTSIAGFNLAKPDGAEIKSYLVTLIELASRAGMLPRNFYELADLVEVPHRLRRSSGLSGVDFDNRVANLITDSARENLLDDFEVKKLA